jgi:hypothetical protein
MTDILRLRALLDAATPGPWYWDEWMDGIRSRNRYIATGGSGRTPNPDDILIIESHAALPALLDELESLRAVAEAAQMSIRGIDGLEVDEMDAVSLVMAISHILDHTRAALAKETLAPREDWSEDPDGVPFMGPDR